MTDSRLQQINFKQ